MEYRIFKYKIFSAGHSKEIFNFLDVLVINTFMSSRFASTYIPHHGMCLLVINLLNIGKYFSLNRICSTSKNFDKINNQAEKWLMERLF